MDGARNLHPFYFAAILASNGPMESVFAIVDNKI